MPAPQRSNTAPAVEAVKRNAAKRAATDPVKVARSLRVVTAAAAAGALSTADVIARLVAAAPAPTPEQIETIRRLLPPVPADSSPKGRAA